ncbi:Imm50 family immunity protein [Streptomyces bauhiniae]|uniref:Imm50 family immunity protein n=1 Tax=Streptomyces bauhiniae TaxID=2340725 RepID=UPI0034524A9C
MARPPHQPPGSEGHLRRRTPTPHRRTTTPAHPQQGRPHPHPPPRPAVPAEPPRKWAAQGFNTVWIELAFSGLSALTLHGFGTEITADIALTAAGDGVAVRVDAPGTTVEALAQTVYLAALRAYAQE